MDLVKAKLFLDKVNREFARMSKDPENIARIDVDIMMSYIRDLYDSLQYATPSAPPTAMMPKSDNRRNINPQHSPKEELPAPTSSEPPPPVQAPPPPPKVENQAPPPPPPEEKPAPAPPPPPPAPVVVPVAPVAPPAPAQNVSPEMEALFEFKEAKELSEKLSQTPVNDLKRAISLNDRLLLAKELFGGDQQLFENAVMNLNNFSDFEQAKSYMIENFVMSYDWANPQKFESAKKFIKLVSRRYK